MPKYPLLCVRENTQYWFTYGLPDLEYLISHTPRDQNLVILSSINRNGVIQGELDYFGSGARDVNTKDLLEASLKVWNQFLEDYTGKSTKNLVVLDNGQREITENEPISRDILDWFKMFVHLISQSKVTVKVSRYEYAN